jgi:hypothetical protein
MENAVKQIAAVPWMTIFMIAVIAVIVGYVAYIFLQYPLSGLAQNSGMARWYVPGVQQFTDMGSNGTSSTTGTGGRLAIHSPGVDSNEKGVKKATEEGFFGGVVRGAGHPDCLRDLNAGAELLGMMGAAAGTPDYEEFQVMLSKIGCMKKDLMSPSGIVQATLYQPYANSHDREAVAEVAAMCLAKTIPERDLDIVFGTWRDRGNVLIRRLCTIASLTEAEAKKAEELFAGAWRDVYDVAKGRCLVSPSEAMYATGSPHDAQPNTTANVEDLAEYKGYFSGWSGGNV